MCVAGDMLGLGSLTLPSVFARLGWIPALIVIVVCGLGTLYSGRLFALLATKVMQAQQFHYCMSSFLASRGSFIDRAKEFSMHDVAERHLSEAGTSLHASLQA